MEGREIVMRSKRLYDASLSGSVESLHELLEEDKLTLARDSITCFNETPLHIASMLGHLNFAKALLNHTRDQVTRLDLQGRSPLHLASANGYVEIVKLLLMIDSNVCLIRDEDRTPLHLAIMNGRVEVVNELTRARSDLTQYTLDRGETILHSCVIYNRLEALKVLLVELSGVVGLVNLKDDNGYTILHTATSLKQKETIRYLLSRTEVMVNAMNKNGFTALDIIEQMPRDLKSMEICELLAKARALRASKVTDLEISGNQQANPNEISPVQQQQHLEAPTTPPNSKMKPLKIDHAWLEKKRDALMVAATVIASMAFQAGINLPNSTIIYYYTNFSVCNTLSFVGSLSVVLLLVSGLPLKRRFFMWILMVAMWMTMTGMAFTYLFALASLQPPNQSEGLNPWWNSINRVITVSLSLWIALIGSCGTLVASPSGSSQKCQNVIKRDRFQGMRMKVRIQAQEMFESTSSGVGIAISAFGIQEIWHKSMQDR